MATIIQTQLSGDKCLVLEPKESCWIEMKHPDNWESLRTTLIISVCETGNLDAEFSPRPINSTYGNVLPVSAPNDQIVFGYTNNNIVLPNTNGYTGNFVGLCNSGSNSVLATSGNGDGFPPVIHSCYGFSVGATSSSHSILCQSDSLKNVTYFTQRTEDNVFRSANKISISAYNTLYNGLENRQNDRTLQQFILTKTGSNNYILSHNFNYFTSKTGNGYGGASASRENMLNFTRDSSFYLSAANQISNIAPFNILANASGGQNGFTGERFEPDYFVINFPFSMCRLRIHGIMTEYFT
jgi:hypothetical protein